MSDRQIFLAQRFADGIRRTSFTQTKNIKSTVLSTTASDARPDGAWLQLAPKQVGVVVPVEADAAEPHSFLSNSSSRTSSFSSTRSESGVASN